MENEIKFWLSTKRPIRDVSVLSDECQFDVVKGEHKKKINDVGNFSSKAHKKKESGERINYILSDTAFLFYFFFVWEKRENTERYIFHSNNQKNIHKVERGEEDVEVEKDEVKWTNKNRIYEIIMWDEVSV